MLETLIAAAIVSGLFIFLGWLWAAGIAAWDGIIDEDETEEPKMENKLDRYFFKGTVICRWPNGKEIRVDNKEALIDAEGPSDAYKRLRDEMVGYLLYNSDENMDHKIIPAFEFHGTMSKALNSFEREEVYENENE